MLTGLNIFLLSNYSKFAFLMHRPKPSNREQAKLKSLFP